MLSIMPKSRSPLNEEYNLGYLMKLDIINIKCPCGKKLVDSYDSAICGACGTATCSDECHDEYLRQKNLCLFHHNFVDNVSTRKIQVQV